MSDIETLKELQDEIRAFRDARGHGRFPDALRERASAWARRRVASGASVSAVCGELGVQASTVKHWAEVSGVSFRPRSAEDRCAAALGASQASSAGVSLIPLLVKRDVEVLASQAARLDVEFPDGTRLKLSGLSKRELLDAVDSLRRTR